jgi:hypothetical protein
LFNPSYREINAPWVLEKVLVQGKQSDEIQRGLAAKTFEGFA